MRLAALLILAGGCSVGQAPPEETAVHLKRGAALLQRNEKQQAVQELKRAVALDPRSAAAHMLLGQAYLSLGSIEMIAEAKAELRQALDLDPGLIWARFYLAKIYLDLGSTAKAREQLELGLQTRNNVPHFLSLLGEVRRQLGEPELSIELNRKALDVDPGMSPAHYYLALALLDLKREEDARLELEKAVQSKYVIPEMYVTLGSIYIARQELRRAEECLLKATALDPSRPEPRLRLAEVYRLAGAHDRAIEQIKAATAAEHRFLHTEYYQRLRADLFYGTGRIQEEKGQAAAALRAYSQALEIDPDHGRTHARLAEVLFRQGEFARAAEHAARAETLGFPVEPALREKIVKAAGAQ